MLKNPKRGTGGFLAWGLIVVLATGLGWWAANQTLSPSSDPSVTSPAPVTYTVKSDMLGRSLDFVAVAEWPLKLAGRNLANGTVTTNELPSSEIVTSGDTLYTVNLRPVVVAEGRVPAFRDLSNGSSGMDVEQAQTFLAGLGFYNNAVNGKFDSKTEDAVRAWQGSLGTTADGVIGRGDLIFVPNLPARATLGESIEVGMTLGGGEEAVRQVADSPQFTMPLSVDQRNLVPLNAKVQVSYPGGKWDAWISEVVETSEGELEFRLEGSEGGSVCEPKCGEVLIGERSNFSAEVIVVPETQGPIIPVAALRTNPGGRVEVQLANGRFREVEVIVSSGGLAVVEGLETGEIVKLSVEEPASK